MSADAPAFGADPPQEILVGDRLVQPSLNQICAGDNLVRLEPKAMQVLLYLASHPGKVLSKEQIIRRVWPDTFVTDQVLTQAIWHVRQALGDHSKQAEFIQTIPKAGYRLVAPVRPAPSGRAAGEQAKAAPGEMRSQRTTIIVAWCVGVLAVVALLLFAPRGWRSRESVPPPIRSLAVLPLSNFSGDPQQDYFADGMTDALITDLAKIRALKVISRTSVMQFKGVKKPLPEVARTLGVEGILEGSVQRSGGRVRITVQLVHAATDAHLWAESYERETRDVLALQSEIATAVTRELRVALNAEESSRLAHARPVNPDAYELYLQGQYHYYKWKPDDFRKAVEFFQKAIAADPRWAPPYAALANTYGWLWIAGEVSPQEALPQFNAALSTALEIDDTLPEVHYTLAASAFYYRWDWEEAEREFQRALALDPNLVEARFEYAWFLSDMGRHGEALAEAQRAVERDPLSVSANLALGDIYFLSRQDEMAIAQLQRTAGLDANDLRAHEFLIGIFEEKQMYPEAIAEIRKARNLAGGPASALAELESAFQRSGPQGYRLWRLAEAERRRDAYQIAMAYAGLRDPAHALAWLEKSYQEHDWRMVQLKSFRVWEPIRSSPRFQALLRRLNLPP